MQHLHHVRRVPVFESAGVQASAASPEAAKRAPRATGRRRQPGQSAVIIALSMLVLVALVGLAIDGGSIYAQRRTAQNAADAASLAAARVMLTIYDALLLTSDDEIDGTYQDDQNIYAAVRSYAQAHQIPPAQLEAYYVNYSKQIVTMTQVGSLGYVPFVAGARGVLVKNRAETGAFFLRMLGWNTVSASASATGFMGVVSQLTNGVPLLPVGFFTTTDAVLNLEVGHEYTLIDSNVLTDTSGNWGYIDFNGSASSNVINAWMACGYNPRLTQPSQWVEYANGQGCGNQNAGQAVGPTKHYLCDTHPDCLNPDPSGAYMFSPDVRWGIGDLGYWLGGQSGQGNARCQDLQQLVNQIGGRIFYVPIFDNWNDSGGTGTRFHLAMVARFWLNDAAVDCHPVQGQQQHWYIRGQFLSFYMTGVTGGPGDLRRTSGHTVFLDN